MKKLQPVLLLLILLSGFTRAQEYQEVLRDIFYEAEFWLVEESYPDALVEYQKLYVRGYENNANINYRMGICYLNIPGEKEKSIPYLEKAVQNLTARYKEGIFKETKAPYDAWLYLGNACRVANELDKAVESYNKYKELIDDPDSEMAHYADKQIEACNNAREAMENPVYNIRDHTGELINSGTADFNPVVSYDEQIMVYMTKLAFYDAIKLSRKENGEWTEPVQITPELEPEGKLYVNSLSRDGQEMYLNLEDNFNSDILISVYEDERWTKARPLSKLINTKFWESHACISGDGQHLYMASNRKGGFGGMDIWVSYRSEAGWTEPVNLGQGINTDLNEDHPFLSEDGKVLYFASQGHKNIGGYDIFYAEKLPDGTWAEPRNLGYPLNTTDDDLFFVPIGNGKYGYQALFAEENLGSRDIYRYQMFESEAEYLAALEPPAAEEVPDTSLLAEEPVEEPAEEPAEEAAEEPGEVLVPVVPAEESPAVSYIIQPVFFAFDKYDLNTEAKARLNRLAEIMELFPAMEIQAVGHTDYIGSENYNLMLSKKRSASVASYITGKGINGRRIKSVGKGEGHPVARNKMPDGSDSPDGRKLNRRVEFQILKPELPNVEIKEVQVPDNLKKY
jgi:outer membrane protein OmpA-like peptidoglycan-associated protein